MRFRLENNLRRPKQEVSFLMKLLKSYLVGNVKRMNDNNVRMAYIGRTAGLPQEIQDTMQWAQEETGTQHRHNLDPGPELRLAHGNCRRHPQAFLSDLAHRRVASSVAARLRTCWKWTGWNPALTSRRSRRRTSTPRICRTRISSFARQRRAAHLKLPAVANCLRGNLRHGPAMA